LSTTPGDPLLKGRHFFTHKVEKRGFGETTMTRSGKIGLWAGAGIGALLVLALVVSLLAPLLIDQQAIRARLQTTLAERMQGTADFETLRISYFPPRGKLSNLSITIPGHDLAGTAESATAYLRILPIFIGRIEIGGVEVRRPDFRLGVPEMKGRPEEEKAEPLSIENLAGAAIGGLAQLRSAQPDLEIYVEKGRMSLTREGKPLIVFSDLNGRVELPPDKLEINIHSASNIWESFRFAAKMDTSSMEGEGRLEVKQLQPHLAMSVLGPQSGIGLGDSRVDGSIRFRMKEYFNIEGEVEASAPKLTLRRGEVAAPLRIEKLKGQYHYSDRQMSLTVTELEMGDPHMKLSGRFLMDRSTPSVLAELSAEEVNVNAVRALSLSLAGDVPMVKRVFDTVKGGVIDQAVITSKGRSWEELAEPEKMDIQAAVSKMEVNVPEVGLDLDGVTGELSLSQGIFKGQDVSARMGNSRASNGDFAIGIQGEDPPFRLNMDFVADLAQGLPILHELVKDETFLEEMKRINHLEGSARGRLALGERMDSLQPKIEIREMNLKGEYERVPYPVEVSAGRFRYEGNQISWSDLDGRMSNTRVAQAAGRIDLGEKARLEVAADKAVLNLGELYPWVVTFGQIPALKELDSVKGQVSLSAIELKGPLKNPKEWEFQGKGEAEDLLVESPRLPAILKVDKAVFSGNPKQIEFEQTQTALLDAALSLSGVVKEYMQGSPQVSLNFEGTIGPQAKEWISATMDLPPEVQLRAPISISQAGLVWGEGAETSLQGNFTVANGPSVVLSISRQPEGGDLLIRELVIDGPDGRAAMSIALREKEIDLQFKGLLSEATMKQIMEKNSYLNGWIRGDFAARIVKDRPEQSRLKGDVQAGEFSYQGGLSSPLLVNSVSLKAADDKIQVEKAELAWRGTEAAIQGTVGLAEKGVQVDLNVSSEGFKWEKVERIIEQEKKKEETAKRTGQPEVEEGGVLGPVPVNGTVAVKAAYFEYGDLRWEPFAFDLNFKGKRVELKITEGRLCGISTDATVKVSPEPMELEAEAKATDKELKQTLSCFLDTGLVSGRFDFTGEIAARGDSEELLRNLGGPFTIDAGKGRIYRFGLLAKIFSVVNITEIFKGRIPDLAGEGFGYKSARITGKIEEGKIVLEEAYIDGNSMGLAFKGGIDLPAKNMDVTVLVTPLKTVDTILENIPILRNILGENFIAIPVQVRGEISNPSVTPLPPSAVGAGLLGILERTLKLPGKLIQPLIPGKKG
jgi:uncharacterized protein involved in outer membrane biogenesis